MYIDIVELLVALAGATGCRMPPGLRAEVHAPARENRCPSAGASWLHQLLTDGRLTMQTKCECVRILGPGLGSQA